LNTLLQHAATIEAVKACKPLADIKRAWMANLAEFRKRREPFLLYD